MYNKTTHCRRGHIKKCAPGLPPLSEVKEKVVKNGRTITQTKLVPFKPIDCRIKYDTFSVSNSMENGFNQNITHFTAPSTIEENAQRAMNRAESIANDIEFNKTKSE